MEKRKIHRLLYTTLTYMSAKHYFVHGLIVVWSCTYVQYIWRLLCITSMRLCFLFRYFSIAFHLFTFAAAKYSYLLCFLFERPTIDSYNAIPFAHLSFVHVFRHSALHTRWGTWNRFSSNSSHPNTQVSSVFLLWCISSQLFDTFVFHQLTA